MAIAAGAVALKLPCIEASSKRLLCRAKVRFSGNRGVSSCCWSESRRKNQLQLSRNRGISSSRSYSAFWIEELAVWSPRAAVTDAPVSSEDSPATASSGSVSEQEEDLEFEKGFSMRKVCDRLIEVFLVDRPEPEEWRKLLAFSAEWERIRPYFYERCKSRAEAEEDPRRMGNLFKLSRKLKEVDDEMIRHNELLKEIEDNILELDVVVAKRRKDFTGDFFKHLRVLCDANHSNLDRREKLVQIASRCLASVEEYDKIAGDNFALDAARQKFDDILNSPSLGDACKKIDRLVKNKQFDPTLMLLISKAWASAKESPMMKEEVKDIMFHLYNVAKGNMQRLVPKEVRILKHLLTIEDPRERLGALAQAFSPGDELEGKEVDFLYTTPSRLYRQVLSILDAYYHNKENTLIQEAQKLMDPLVISRLEVLRDVIKAEFL